MSNNQAETKGRLAPSSIVIFGITGDLSRRYLLPALYHLCKDRLLPKTTTIIGTSRQALELDDFLGQVEVCVLEQDKICDPLILRRLRQQLRLVQLNPSEGQDYAELLRRINGLENEFGVCMNRLYYLSLPPQVYGPVLRNLGLYGLNGSCQHNIAETRLLVEKPFGYDLASAKELIENTAQQFQEKQVFRIDHYLAKEIAQKILPFRRRNSALEAMWNGANIEQVDVIAYETLGIEGRKFYDNIGALRDFVQSHLLQLLALITMELPEALDAGAVHAAKERLLKSIEPVPADKVRQHVRRAQYAGYRAQVGISDSTTETFVSLDLTIPTPRWQNTAFRLATGKALQAKQTEITVFLKGGNRLSFRIQPTPAINLALAAQGGTALDLSDVVTNVQSTDSAIIHAGADAYESVLVDAIRGDQTLFASSAEVLASWHILQPVIDQWQKSADDLASYPMGSTAQSVLDQQI